jgi:hypothetical protein
MTWMVVVFFVFFGLVAVFIVAIGLKVFRQAWRFHRHGHIAGKPGAGGDIVNLARQAGMPEAMLRNLQQVQQNSAATQTTTTTQTTTHSGGATRTTTTTTHTTQGGSPPRDNPPKDETIACPGCGATGIKRAGQSSKCDYCDTVL